MASESLITIQSATIDANGKLIFTKSDGSTEVAGNIVQLVLDSIPSGDGVKY